MTNLDKPFAGAEKKRSITKQHTVLVWENMLGTVCARSPSGHVSYFDYDYKAAHRFAETSKCSDLRVVRNKTPYWEGAGPRAGRFALFGVRSPEKVKPKKELTDAQKAERRRKARERHWIKTGAAGAIPWMKKTGWL